MAGAAATLRTALDLEPTSINTAALLANTLLNLNRAREARAVAATLRIRLPNSPHALRLEAALAERDRDLVAAEKLLLQAQKIDPTGTTALQLYGVQRKLKNSNADEGLVAALDRDPADARLALAVSEAREAGGDRRGAIRALEGSRDLPGPLQAAALNNLAWLYYAAGDARALATARAAEALAPKNGDVVDTLGWILLNEGDTKAALEKLRTAYRLKPDSEDIALHLATAESQAGFPAEAKKRLDELKARAPAIVERDEYQKLRERLARN